FADQFPTQQRRVAARDRLIDLGQSPAPVRVRRLPTYVTASDPFADPSFGACLSSSTGEAAISACRQAYTRFPDIPIVRVRLCGLLGSEINCQLSKSSTSSPPMAPSQGTTSGSDTGSGVATATTDPSANSAPGQQPSPSTAGTLQPATAAPDNNSSGSTAAALPPLPPAPDNNSSANNSSANNPSGNNSSGNNPSGNNSSGPSQSVLRPAPPSGSAPHPNQGDQERGRGNNQSGNNP